MPKPNEVWNDFTTWLKGALNGILKFLDPLARQIATAGGQLLLATALDAVLAAEKAGGTGEAKLAAARSVVVARLQTAGIPIVLNAINGAIEAAVAQMNASKQL